MYFGSNICGVLILCMCFITISESVVIDISGPLNTNVGGTVFFKWNSNVKLLEAVWGIRSGNSLTANPQYIYVDDTDVPVINPALDASLKKRLHYNGNLAAGRAWFSISNATPNDSDTYIALIREEGYSSQASYYVQVVVTGIPTTATAPSTATSTPTPSPLTSSNPILPTTPTTTRVIDDFPSD